MTQAPTNLRPPMKQIHSEHHNMPPTVEGMVLPMHMSAPDARMQKDSELDE